MAKITITIPDDKLDAATAGFLALYPNTETKPNPDYVDAETTPEGTKELPVYTDSQWIKEKVKQNLIRDIHRGLSLIERRGLTAVTDKDIAG